jgi:hypothetical protein
MDVVTDPLGIDLFVTVPHVRKQIVNGDERKNWVRAGTVMVGTRPMVSSENFDRAKNEV